MEQFVGSFGGSCTSFNDEAYLTAEDIGGRARNLLERVSDGEVLGEAELAGFLILIAHLHNPIDYNPNTGLPTDPVPGVEYDSVHNWICMQWR